MQAYLEQSGQMEHFSKFLEGKQSELIKIRHKTTTAAAYNQNGGSLNEMQKNRSHSLTNVVPPSSEIIP